MFSRRQNDRQIQFSAAPSRARLAQSPVGGVVRFFLGHLIFFAAILLAARFANAATAVKAEITRIGDATHLEFSGNGNDWKYTLKREGGKGDRVILRISGVKPEILEMLKGHNDALIRSVTTSEGGIDGTAEVVFSLGSNVDFFDYIADQPSRLIVDFFPKESAEKSPAKKTTLKAQAAPDEGSDRVPASDDDDDGDDSLFVKNAPSKLPVKVQKRKPASGDFIFVAKADKNATGETQGDAPSLAEQISSKQDFSHGIFDGGDPEFRRFSIKDYEVKPDAIEASKVNFFLPFPMLDLGTPALKSLISAAPSYEIVPNDTRENKEARVLLTLFSTKKPALFLKTAAEFLKSYPSSQYSEIVRYMMADTHYDAWRAEGSEADFETAMGMYLQLAENFPQSTITPRTLLLMGCSYLDRGDSFGALKTFQKFKRIQPNSKYIDRVNISIAEGYLALNRYDDAFALYDQIEKTAKSAKLREEAAFRKGDVFFRKRDYAAALQQYKDAIHRHPAAAERFPNVSYNIAEAEFATRNYRESLEAYRDFLQKFPDHEHGGYAMTRMGELLGILGADSKRSQGAFLESYFRYRATPGAGIARIRLLTSRMPEMKKEKELADALNEINEISQKYSNHPEKKKRDEKSGEKVADAQPAAKPEAKSEGKGEGGGEGKAEKTAEKAPEKESSDSMIEDPTKKPPELAGIEEFSTLLISDAYTVRGEYDKAAKDLIGYYQKNPRSPNANKFKVRIARNVAEAIRADVDRGDFIDALRRYSKDSNSWLKSTDRIDVRYNVGRAYEQAGVFKEAASVYADSLKRLVARKEKAFLEEPPKEDELHLRLAAVAAKAKDFSGAETQLKKIAAGKSPSQLTQPEEIERAEVSADVAEARGQGEIARKYLSDLINTWKGDPELTSPLHLRMAHLDARAKNFKEADAHLAKIIDFRKKSAKVSDDVYAKALEYRGDLLISRGKRKDAVLAYKNLLEQYESTRPLASVRYRLGQVLYEDGDLKAAEAIWAELKPDKDNVWQRLASEQMQGAKWQNEYKKYLNRIPAAVDLRSEAPPVSQAR